MIESGGIDDGDECGWLTADERTNNSDKKWRAFAQCSLSMRYWLIGFIIDDAASRVADKRKMGLNGRWMHGGRRQEEKSRRR